MCPSGRIGTAFGGVTARSTGSSHVLVYCASASRTRSVPRRNVECAGLADVEQYRPCLMQGSAVIAIERGLRPVVAQHARTDRMTLGVMRIQQALRDEPHLRELPSQVHCILDADVESLPADGRMDARRPSQPAGFPCAAAIARGRSCDGWESR